MKYTLFTGMAGHRAAHLPSHRRAQPLWVATARSILANHHTYTVLNFAACADLDREFAQFLKKEVKGYECR